MNSQSTQAGTFTVLDVNNTTAVNTGSATITDIKSATYASSTWTFDWTPPPAGTTDSVTFYLTGLAVNPLPPPPPAPPFPRDTGIDQATLTLPPPPPAPAPSLPSSTN